MMITNNVTMDLMLPGYPAVMYAVQEDRYTRQLRIELKCSGMNWPVPENVALRVRYARPDGTGGEYDTLPDGSSAWSAIGNVLTVLLAPQVLEVAGSVSLWITLLQGQIQLSTFPVLLHVTSKTVPADNGTHTDVGGMILTDTKTQLRYRVYVSGGELMMEVMN